MLKGKTIDAFFKRNGGNSADEPTATEAMLVQPPLLLLEFEQHGPHPSDFLFELFYSFAPPEISFKLRHRGEGWTVGDGSCGVVVSRNLLKHKTSGCCVVCTGGEHLNQVEQLSRLEGVHVISVMTQKHEREAVMLKGKTIDAFFKRNGGNSADEPTATEAMLVQPPLLLLEFEQHGPHPSDFLFELFYSFAPPEISFKLRHRGEGWTMGDGSCGVVVSRNLLKHKTSGCCVVCTGGEHLNQVEQLSRLAGRSTSHQWCPELLDMDRARDWRQ